MDDTVASDVLSRVANELAFERRRGPVILCGTCRELEASPTTASFVPVFRSMYCGYWVATERKVSLVVMSAIN